MRTFRFRLRPLSSWASPWRADTIFGAICWAIADRAGTAALTTLLDRFRAGDPPFVISDACPGDLLPRPLVAVPDPPEVRVEKAWKQREWLTPAGFLAAREGRPVPVGEARTLPVRSLSIAHATIDRRHGTTSGGGGALFETEEWAFEIDANIDAFFSLYFRATAGWDAQIGGVLAWVGLEGLGKRRSSGRGAFEVAGAAEPRPDLDPRPDDDGFVSLSHFVPAAADPAFGIWKTRVTDPKLARGARPFKRPVITITPGSCFRLPVAHRPAPAWVGSTLSRIVPDSAEVIHYGFGFPVSIRWPSGDHRAATQEA